MSLQHKELMSAIKSMDDKINKRMDNIETIIAEFKNMKEHIVNLSKKQENQSHELTTISNELHTIKQNMLDNDFIITGVPESISEISTLNTVNNVLNYYKVKITENDVKSCFRMRNNDNKSGCSPICVQLNSKTLRAAIFYQQRKLGPVLLSSINNSVSEDKRKIYIQNRLTPFNQELLKDARKFKLDNNYKYAWFQNTDVLLKETDSSKIVRIRSKADLLALETQSSK